MNIALKTTNLLDTKYHGTDVSVVHKYAKVPFIYRLNGDRKTKYAIELIDMLNLKKGQEQSIDYKLEYQTDTINNLIERQLIKVIANDDVTISSKAIHSKGITVSQAENIMTDIEAEEVIINKISTIDDSHKAIINIDKLNKHFDDDDLVTLKRLKELKLVPKKTTFIKVLASGTLNKRLVIESHDYSLTAVKMIKLTKGQVIKLAK